MSTVPGTDIHAALRLHQSGDLSRAEAMYREILEADPQQADAHHLLGVLAHQTGRFAAAVGSIREAIRLRPGLALYHCNLGAALQELGESDAAIASYRQTLTLSPRYAQAYFNLGVALESQGRKEEAQDAYRQTLRLEPAHPQAHNNLGNGLLGGGKPADAEHHLRRALDRMPEFAEAHFNLGNALRAQGRLPEACDEFRIATNLNSSHIEGFFNLATVLRLLGKRQEAAETYQDILRRNPSHSDSSNNLAILMRELGRFAEAETTLQSALRHAPRQARLHYNLGNVHLGTRSFDKAIECFRAAIEFDPQFAEAHNNLGTAFLGLGSNRDADACFRSAIRIQPDFSKAHNNLGLALNLECRQAESVAAYREALRLKSDYHEAHSNILLAMNYDSEIDPAVQFVEHCRWSERHTRGVLRLPPCFVDRDPERRLRIGYASGDFRGHVMSHFMEPFLAHHDRDRFDVFAYAELAVADAVTERLRRHVPHWRNTFGVSDPHVAEQIREDRIDILVDLAGHTAGNRLHVFAMKPAPIQVTGLGYGTTTGLDTIDYRLTDPVADPPGEPRLHTEELTRLPQGVYCYQPPADTPAVAELPARANGYVTFGSFNNLAKLTPQALALWCRVLKQVPTSRLLLKHRSLEYPRTRDLFRTQFLRRGIDGERVELMGKIPSMSGHLEMYSRVDIALDPFPYTGLTTTYDALWMGVPVLTLRGTSFVGRMSASVLTFSGMTDLIAETPDEYVARGVDLASNPEALAQRRRNMRDQLASSPACDAVGYTRHLEQAFREMWRAWCVRDELEASSLVEMRS